MNSGASAPAAPAPFFSERNIISIWESEERKNCVQHLEDYKGNYRRQIARLILGLRQRKFSVYLHVPSSSPALPHDLVIQWFSHNGMPKSCIVGTDGKIIDIDLDLPKTTAPSTPSPSKASGSAPGSPSSMTIFVHDEHGHTKTPKSAMA